MTNQVTKMFIRTDALSQDDRVNKISKLLKEACDVQTVAFVKNGEKVRSGTHLVMLHSRHWNLPKLIRLVEFVVKQIFWYFKLNKGGILWLNNEDFIFVLFFERLFSRHEKTVVDFHELPRFIAEKSRIQTWLWRWLLKRSHIIHANEYRSSLVRLSNVGKQNYVLRNYPSAVTNAKLSQSESYEGSKSIGIFGLPLEGRYILESIDCVLKSNGASSREKQYKMYLVGSTRNQYRIDLSPQHVFTGRLTHTELIDYYNRVDICLCFYGGSSLNNKLCEPNRFFQAYNANKHIVTFDHVSLNEFFDDGVHIINEEDFHEELFALLINNSFCNKIDRKLVVFESQRETLGTILKC